MSTNLWFEISATIPTGSADKEWIKVSAGKLREWSKRVRELEKELENGRETTSQSIAGGSRRD